MKIEVLKKSMTKEIIEKIIDIDKEFYVDFDYQNNKQWYYNRYTDKNQIFLLCVNDKIVGYFLFHTITKQLFNDILSLKYDGDYNFPERSVNVQSNYFYIPSVLIKKRYRKHGVALLRRLLDEAKSKPNLVAITISKQGKRMAESMMKLIGVVDQKRDICVYAKTV